MKFNPNTHHRRSIRLPAYDYTQPGAYFVTICTWHHECLFGEVLAGEMRLSAIGKIVQWEWKHLEQRFPNLQLGPFVIMPNHLHAIIIINETVGATQADLTQNIPATGNNPTPDTSGKGGSPRPRHIDTIGMESNPNDTVPNCIGRATSSEQNLINEQHGAMPDKPIEDIVGSPVQPRAKGPAPGSLGAITGQLKSRVTKRVRKLPGMGSSTIWQRNYYEHILRDDADLQHIQAYILANPQRWEDDQLHPRTASYQFNR